MDRKVIKITELSCLQNIAATSTVLLFETDAYIELLQAVSQYLSNPVEETQQSLQYAHDNCIKQYPIFNQTRIVQRDLLLLNHNLVEIPAKESVPVIEDIPPPPPNLDNPRAQLPNNVVQLFGKKKVDKPQ
jgi:hypothetical protein